MQENVPVLGKNGKIFKDQRSSCLQLIFFFNNVEHLFCLFVCKFIYFIYLFLAALGFGCCTRAFSSCGEWGLLFVAVRGLLTVVASLVAEHGLQARGLQ